ncbi:OsmC family peroxiredoxin [Candidatus Saccharibacteria bacterium]|nr:OsmC family peroxiredoxin [Candidatus Saccharibacteria bacterium]NIW79581.1 OsmC family peroxiredoxin [Calditrichia bacterium]
MGSGTQSTPQPKIKHKTFTFRTHSKRVAERAGMLGADEKPEFRVASPPEFKGESGVWTPEDLFVAAVEACTLTTFSAFAQKKGIAIESYSSTAEGVLEFVDGRYRFTKVYLRPEIIVSSSPAVEQTEKTIHDAHKSCLITNSITADVILEPVIKVSEDA